MIIGIEFCPRGRQLGGPLFLSRLCCSCILHSSSRSDQIYFRCLLNYYLGYFFIEFVREIANEEVVLFCEKAVLSRLCCSCILHSSSRSDRIYFECLLNYCLGYFFIEFLREIANEEVVLFCEKAVSFQ